eukprot:Colp12_sorted_trinity150504_noHs@29248
MMSSKRKVSEVEEAEGEDVHSDSGGEEEGDEEEGEEFGTVDPSLLSYLNGDIDVQNLWGEDTTTTSEKPRRPVPIAKPTPQTFLAGNKQQEEQETKPKSKKGKEKEKAKVPSALGVNVFEVMDELGLAT